MKLIIGEDTKLIFNAMREGILIIDKDENIVFANQAYLDFIHKNFEEIEGKKIREVRHSAKLPETLSGKRGYYETRKENKESYFVNMYPLEKEGEIVGGMSVVFFMEDVYHVKEVIEKYEKQSRQMMKQINVLGSEQFTFDDIIAEDKSSVEIKALAEKIAATDATVLLQSESGTGKEVYARAIHNAGSRSGEIFVAINCANFNAQMLEAELFGYTSGSFTGAKKGGKIGLFEAAEGGTIFLDEIAEMDIGLQAKLLRVLQERTIRPLGSLKEKKINVRIICACNADLEKAIAQGRFRQDLYYRINVFKITIPPLRERKADIMPLCMSILKGYEAKLHKKLSMTPEAMEALVAYDWPGNVRELKNILEFTAYLADNGCITKAVLPDNIFKSVSESGCVRQTLAERVKAFEKEEIERLLKKNGSDLKGKKQTAKELGISLASLYNKINSK